MIFGINAFMLRGRSFEEICRICASAGCSWISLEVEQLYEEHFIEILKKYRLHVNCVGALFLDVDKKEESLKKGKNVIRQCGIRKTPALNIVLSSAWPDLEWMADAVVLCRKLAEYGAKYQVRVAAEPLHPKMRAVSCLTQLWQAKLLCDYVNHSNFGVTVDLYHCGGMKDPENWFGRLTGQIFAVHISDAVKDGSACFPGLGVQPVRCRLLRLSQVYPEGIAELEVVSGDLAGKSEKELTEAIRKSMLLMSRVIVIGELALHRFLDADGRLKKEELGGGAGMIAAQIEELGISPWLIGTFGLDPAGQRLLTELEEYGVETESVIQDETTSVVSICGETLTIQAGTVQLQKLASVAGTLPDEDCLVYLPVFPSYEPLLEAVSRKKKWRKFCDFGYFAWCGDFSVLSGLLQTFSGGYCALLNGKDMEYAKKEVLGRLAVEAGYRYAVLTDGSQDVLLFEADQMKTFSVIAAPSVKSSCGAGDCLTAGILLGLSGGYDMEEALCFGIQIAYHKVQTEGVWRKKSGKRNQLEESGERNRQINSSERKG